jgi:hypothetical protein
MCSVSPYDTQLLEEVKPMEEKEEEETNEEEDSEDEEW